MAAVAEVFVLQVMLHREASSLRTLGVAEDADRTEILAHMRDLLKWLHPDRNPNAWRAAFAGRVIDAWRRVDRGLEDEKPRSSAVRMSRSRRLYRVAWIARPLEPARGLSRRRLARWLRVLLTGLTLGAGITVPDEATYGVGQAFLATLLLDEPERAVADAGSSGGR
ncbi:MAG: hypothetical protein ACLQE9_01825 [Roseiarcus sp.]